MKLNNIPLELDNRISDIADIKTIITADENDVGKMGYFANSIHLFKNLKGLDGIKYGKLIYLSDLDYGGDKSDKCFVCSNQWAYRYFVPEDVLKPVEKKYRPLSYKEFWRLFDFGDGVCFRRKGQDTAEFSMFLGYEIDSDGNRTEIPGEGKVNLGGNRYTLAELFEYYEMQLDDEWQPFGVIDEQGAGE